MSKPLICDAIISNDGIYRFRLRRIWEEKDGLACFIGLNPSVANETEDDPTIRRCVGFARRLGLGGISMVNLFGYRSTDARVLLFDAVMPIRVGNPKNDLIMLEECRNAKVIIAAWGAHKWAQERAMNVVRGLKRDDLQLYCLGLCKEGEPRHPLYLKSDTELVAYEPQTSC